MNHRERVAHHEAAHAVIAIFYKAGLTAHGIDLNAPTSVQGASGNAGVNIYVPDFSDPEPELRITCISNLAIICAGAAADARIEGTPLRGALASQTGDEAVARQEAARYPFCSTPAEIEGALVVALDVVWNVLAKPHVWSAVEALAAKLLAQGGKLSSRQVLYAAVPCLNTPRKAVRTSARSTTP